MVVASVGSVMSTYYKRIYEAKMFYFIGILYASYLWVRLSACDNAIVLLHSNVMGFVI